MLVGISCVYNQLNIISCEELTVVLDNLAAGVFSERTLASFGIALNNNRTPFYTLGKYSFTKSTSFTWKLLPLRFSRLPASVVKQKVSL